MEDTTTPRLVPREVLHVPHAEQLTTNVAADPRAKSHAFGKKVENPTAEGKPLSSADHGKFTILR